jgi:hypothetical protein
MQAELITLQARHDELRTTSQEQHAKLSVAVTEANQEMVEMSSELEGKIGRLEEQLETETAVRRTAVRKRSGQRFQKAALPSPFRH